MSLYQLPDSVIASAVRISNTDRTIGSGFLYMTESNDIYLVTAKHVLVNKSGNLINDFITVHATKLIQESRFPIHVSINFDEAPESILKHASRDICAVKIMHFVKQKTPNSITIGYPEYVVPGKSDTNTGDFKFIARTKIGVFDSVELASECFLIGFPHSLRKHNQKEIEIFFPLLRKGIIAGKNHQERLIVLDCEVNYGNSGGPAFQVNFIAGNKVQFKLFGIISSFLPYSEEYANIRNPSLKHEYIQNSGYSVVVPIDFLGDIIPL